ncbi:MAG TPA: NF038122 family metalloprotease, partial [Bryobacteraceae bacterium]|nr:NF038122 family metalloprotease [Bryobacteraceae bacterium]
MNIVKSLAGIGVAFALSTGSAHAGLIFNWSGSTGNAQADAGFDAAALRWSNLFSDNITINASRGYSALGSGILGSTSVTDTRYAYSLVKSKLVSDATSASDATAIANLPGGSAVNMLTNRTSNSPNGPGSATPYLDNNGNANNTNIDISSANAKALGLLNANNAASDGSITFSTAFNFDFDPTDGITAGEYDFVGVATHEIGHLLGFFSGVDDLDFYA